MTTYPMPAVTRSGGTAADVVYVFCLLQAAFVVLAGLGELLLMGNPVYLLLPLAKLVLLVVLGAAVVSGRRWAIVTLIVVQAVTLIGFWLQLAAGLVPGLTFTVNPVGLITNVGLPTTVIWLCASLLASSSSSSLSSSSSRFSSASSSARTAPAGPGAPVVAATASSPVTQTIASAPGQPWGAVR